MKYKLGEKHKDCSLYRVIAIENFGDVKTGDVGGYISSEANLSQPGDAWVYGNAQIYGDARVYGNAQIYGDAWVYGDARVYGNAQIYGNLKIDYTPLNIIGLKYSVTIFQKSSQIQAGCYLKTVKEWEGITQFDDQDFLDEWKNKILEFAT